MTLLALTDDEALELLQLLELQSEIESQNQIEKYFLDEGKLARQYYPAQMDFFNAGMYYKLRMFMAANRVGKTFTAAYEIACHVTGIYPDWWKGKRFKFANNWWVCGIDNTLVQSQLQKELLGEVGEFGTGMIPGETIDWSSLTEAKKADTSVGMLRINHVSGAQSSIQFKSYESGRKAFQSAQVNVWLDEEPPLPIFLECLLRTMSTGNELLDDPILLMTFTPLMGMSETVLNFVENNVNQVGPVFDKDGKKTIKYVTHCTWDDVPHLSENDKAELLKTIPPWARDARTRGIPSQGSGAIYPIQWEDISVKRFEIPKHWKRYAGLDVGGKTAAIWFAIDPSTNTHYGYHEYYREGELPAVHVQGIGHPGLWIPIAIDHAAHGRSQIDGENLFDLYKGLGLKLTNANKAVETGLYTCWELLATGKVKIFDDLKRFKEEYLIYHKDEKGRVVKERDHMMDAFRYAMMTGRELAQNELEATPSTYNYSGVSQQYRPQRIL